MNIEQRMQASPIKMGMEVENTITGLRGVVTSFALSSSGSFQAGVQPRAVDNVDKDAMNFDVFSLKQVAEGTRHASIPPVEGELLKFQPGDTVVSTINRMEGGVECVAVHINGCVFALVAPPYNPASEKTFEYISVRNLKLKKGAKEHAAKMRATGGPSLPNLQQKRTYRG